MRYSVAAMVVLLVAGVAVADDVLPPTWRGQGNTVTAAWDMWGPAGLGPGMVTLTGDQVTTNPPGAFSGIAAVAQWNSSAWVYDTYNGRTGVIEINPGGGLGPLSFGLLNFPDDNLQKRIRLQITFQGAGVMDFYVVSGGGDPGPFPWPGTPWTKLDAIVSESYQHDDGWQTSAYDLVIEPNPAWEVIMLDWGYIGPQTWVSWIDQVVIDTQCVPEPATLGLLLLGGLALIRRRK